MFFQNLGMSFFFGSNISGFVVLLLLFNFGYVSFYYPNEDI